MQLKHSWRLDVSKKIIWREAKEQNLFRYRKQNSALMMTNQQKKRTAISGQLRELVGH